MLNLTKPTRQYPCAVSNVAISLPEDDGKILLDAVNDPEWPYKSLEDALGKNGIVLSQGSIKKHRIKACSCFRSQ